MTTNPTVPSVPFTPTVSGTRNTGTSLPSEKVLLDRLTKAKAHLVMRAPFFGYLTMSMKHFLTDAIPTAGTNGFWVAWNPNFVNELTDAELLFVMAHESMHPMLEHCFRRHNRDPQLWNMAGDYVINQHLHDDNIGKMPDGGCFNPAIYKAGNGITDNIYEILATNKGGGGNAGGSPLDICFDAPGDTSQQTAQQAEWSVRVAQAAQAAKMCGQLSAGLERLVQQALHPKVPWADVLRQFVQKAKTDERNFGRPNRRYIPHGLYLPSRSGEQMGPVLVAVDCSGSIGPKELDEFAAEVRAIHEDCRPSTLHVVYFDSSISHHDEFTPEDTLKIEAHGGGGTAFSPIFRFAEANEIEPVCCIVLTDLYCSDFGPAPSYPVLWVSNGADKAPWGEVVMM